MLVPCALMAMALWRTRVRQGNWSQVISAPLLNQLISDSTAKASKSGVPALLAAWAIATIAAAGPSWQQLPQPVLQKQDALVIVLDLSYSMLATDLQPSRQDRVRRKLLDLLRERREGLTSLIAYAGDAHIVAPLTDDNPTIANLLPALSPQMMPLPGSNPVEAIQLATELLDSAGVRRGRILLVTDGVQERDVNEINQHLDGQERELVVMGVGTKAGAPIPLPGGGFLKDRSGEIVVPALDEQILNLFSDSGNASYSAMTVDDSDLTTLLSVDLDLDDNDTISLDRSADRWQDMAHWLVLPLLLFSLASFRRGWVYILPLAFFISPSERALALEWQDLWLRADQQGQKALAGGDTENAANLFENERWRGVASYQNEDYETAESAFSSAASTNATADDLYNRGNALAAQGRLDEAIEAYKASLEKQPNQADALKNIDTLEKLKEDQESENEQSDPEGAPQDNQGNDGQQQSSDQQSEPQNSGNSPSNSPSGDEKNQDSNEQSSESPQGQGSDNAEDDPGSQGAEDQAESSKELDVPKPQIDNSAMQEDLERDQAMQQWLRRIPDDPSGLLREKFRYESNRRQQQGRNRDNVQVW